MAFPGGFLIIWVFKRNILQESFSFLGVSFLPLQISLPRARFKTKLKGNPSNDFSMSQITYPGVKEKLIKSHKNKDGADFKRIHSEVL